MNQSRDTVNVKPVVPEFPSGFTASSGEMEIAAPYGEHVGCAIRVGECRQVVGVADEADGDSVFADPRCGRWVVSTCHATAVATDQIGDRSRNLPSSPETRRTVLLVSVTARPDRWHSSRKAIVEPSRLMRDSNE